MNSAWRLMANEQARSAEATIAEHWGCAPEAVTVSIESAHGGWVACASIDFADRAERWSEVSVDRDRAIAKLVVSSWHRHAVRNPGAVESVPPMMPDACMPV